MSYDFTKGTDEQKQKIAESLHEHIEPMCAGIVLSGLISKGEQILSVQADVTEIWINVVEWHFTVSGFKQLTDKEVDSVAQADKKDWIAVEELRKRFDEYKDYAHESMKFYDRQIISEAFDRVLSRIETGEYNKNGV